MIGWLLKNHPDKDYDAVNIIWWNKLTLTTWDILDILLSARLTSSCSHGRTTNELKFS